MNGPDGEEIIEQDHPEHSKVFQHVSNHVLYMLLIEPDILVDGPMSDVGCR